VDLVWLDEATPQDAVQSITRLIEETKVVAVLGGTSSATTVCTENLVRFDSMTESLNFGRDGRADIPSFEPGCLGLQVQEPT
jgi:hypothetical protein